MTIATIIFQTLYFRKLNVNEYEDEDSFVEMRLDDIEIESYKRRYESFMNFARDDTVDLEIKEYLARQGYGTMKTEASLISNLK